MRMVIKLVDGNVTKIKVIDDVIKVSSSEDHLRVYKKSLRYTFTQKIVDSYSLS